MRNILTRIILLTVVFIYTVPAISQEIVVNSSLPVDAISQAKLRSIFSMRVKAWDDDTPIKVFILSRDSQVHREFCVKKLEVFPYQLQRIWDVMLFSGTGVVPEEVDSVETMLEKISRTPGSIGYINEQKEVPLNVKALHLQ